jgi:predicted nucleotidyltransferase
MGQRYEVILQTKVILIFLFTFSEKAPSLFDFPKIKEELETIVGRKVDINTRNAIENARNPLLKEEILSTVKVVYEQKKS